MKRANRKRLRKRLKELDRIDFVAKKLQNAPNNEYPLTLHVSTICTSLDVYNRTSDVYEQLTLSLAKALRGYVTITKRPALNKPLHTSTEPNPIDATIVDMSIRILVDGDK